MNKILYLKELVKKETGIGISRIKLKVEKLKEILELKTKSLIKSYLKEKTWKKIVNILKIKERTYKIYYGYKKDLKQIKQDKKKNNIFNEKDKFILKKPDSKYKLKVLRLERKNKKNTN